MAAGYITRPKVLDNGQLTFDRINKICVCNAHFQHLWMAKKFKYDEEKFFYSANLLKPLLSFSSAKVTSTLAFISHISHVVSILPRRLQLKQHRKYRRLRMKKHIAMQKALHKLGKALLPSEDFSVRQLVVFGSNGFSYALSPSTALAKALRSIHGAGVLFVNETFTRQKCSRCPSQLEKVYKKEFFDDSSSSWRDLSKGIRR